MKVRFDAQPPIAAETHGVSVQYAAAKRRVPRWRWYLLLALVLAAPAYLLLRFLSDTVFGSAAGVVVTQQAVLRAGSAGRVVRAEPVGSRLLAGAPFAWVSPDGAVPAAAPASPAAAWDLAVPAPDADIDALLHAVQLQQRQVALHAERLATLRGLARQQAATRQEVLGAEAQWLAAQADARRAQRDLDGARAQRAAIARQQAVVPADAAPPVPAAVPTHVPFDAVVVRQFVYAGEWVSPGTEVGVVQGSGPALVHAYIAPAELRYAQVGRRATLRFFDGGRIGARVVGSVGEAERLPAERVSPLAPRTPSVVVRLEADGPLPDRYRVHNLPLDVRFDWVAPWQRRGA